MRHVKKCSGKEDFCVQKGCYVHLNKDEILDHYKQNHFDIKSVHECHDCLKVFQYNFAYHIKKNHGKNFYCEYCGMGFVNENQLKDHVSKKHSEEESLKKKCKHCLGDFKNLASLYTHERYCPMNPAVNSSVQPKKSKGELFECKSKKCKAKKGKKFTLEEFKKHNKQCGKNPNSFQCPRCKKLFAKESNLQHHVMRNSKECNRLLG